MKNPTPVIKELRERGYYVDVKHYRMVVSSGNGDKPFMDRYDLASRALGYRPLPTGGSTYVAIRKGRDGAVLAAATTRCSDRDNYNKHRGVAIALGRAMCNAQRDGVVL